MLPDPLHPAVIHFPIVLALALPLVAVTAVWMARRGVAPRRAWTAVILVGTLLLLTAWLAVRTGEGQEEAVERVVTEAPLERHEEAGERFLFLSGIALGLIALGLLPGAAGRTARAVGCVAAAGLTLAAWQAGHTGGELVYRYGAANAYLTGAAAVPQDGGATTIRGGAAGSATAEDEERAERADRDRG